MRYRALSETGDYTFGQGSANFLVNNPACVAQRVQTRLLLLRGEWFLDTTDGTPWSTEILGENTKPLYDNAIQSRVLDTPGVSSIEDYSSEFDGHTRHLAVSMTINTIYGQDNVEVVL